MPEINHWQKWPIWDPWEHFLAPERWTPIWVVLRLGGLGLGKQGSQQTAGLTTDSRSSRQTDSRSSRQTSEAHNRQLKLTTDMEKLTKGSRSSQDRHGEAHSFPLLCELASERGTGASQRYGDLEGPEKSLGSGRAPQVAKIYNGKLPHNHESKMNPVSHEMPLNFLKP